MAMKGLSGSKKAIQSSTNVKALGSKKGGKRLGGKKLGKKY